jgi:hypothetical protein
MSAGCGHTVFSPSILFFSSSVNDKEERAQASGYWTRKSMAFMCGTTLSSNDDNVGCWFNVEGAQICTPYSITGELA